MKNSLINHIKRNKPFCHFSVDDVYRIFENKNSQAAKFLKSLHDDFGLIISLHAFSSPTPDKKNFLRKVPTNFLADYHWLKFGSHCPDWNHPYNTLTVKEQIKEINDVYKELKRIAGKDYLSENIRLHLFKGSKDACQLLSKKGVKTIFTTDFHPNRLDYCMTPRSRDELYRKGFYFDKQVNICFVKSGFRIEFDDDDEKDTIEHLKKFNFCVFYAHEEFLTDPTTQKRIRKVLEMCQKRKIPFI